MSEAPTFDIRSDVTTHGTFVIERDFAVPPAKAFAAFATEEAKRAWFRPPSDWMVEPETFEFAVGGAERHVSVSPDGARHGYDGRYLDIAEGERIIFTYTMDFDGVPLSASLVTVQLTPNDAGTHMTFTEQGAYFLEGDPTAITAGREMGTQIGIDQLEDYLAS